MPKLTFQIKCGHNTCAHAPGKFCEWVRTTKFGQLWYCHLFSEERYDHQPIPLEEKNGYLQRHPKCLETEEKSWRGQ